MGALSCPQCHALVHAKELEKLSAEARALEELGEFRKAREHWMKLLEYLPQESNQSEWVRGQVKKLEWAKDTAATPEKRHEWARKLGPLAPIAIALAKSKTLLAIFNLKFLVSLAAFMGLYWQLYGLRFGVGFAVTILIHEMGHFIDIKRRGLPADMPVFLPGFGAYVRWQAIGVSARTRAAVSLAGPLAGCIAATACLVLWWKTGNGVWSALARATAWLNVMNLIPVWVLDGGQAAHALDKAERLVLLTGCIILWAVFSEKVFLLVALGAGYRLFTKNMPPHPSRPTIAYFLAVLTALGSILWFVPGEGFDAP